MLIDCPFQLFYLIEYSRTKANKARKIEKCPKTAPWQRATNPTNKRFCKCLPKFTVLIKKHGKLQVVISLTPICYSLQTLRFYRIAANLFQRAGIYCLDFISALIKAVIALFIIVDPFGNIPIFVSLTENMTDDSRQKVYNTAVIVGLILLLVFSFTGTYILQLFGITLESFEVAGGILLLIISIRILISGTREKAESPENIGAVPIAMPLLVGPGAITTIIITLQTYQNVQPNGAAISVTIAVLAAVIVLALTWVILRYTNGLYKFLGKTGSIVIARVMALLISAIAIQYILDGISHFMFLSHILLSLL